MQSEGLTHSLADTYFSQNTSVGVRGYAADRYAKSKDTGYKKVIATTASSCTAAPPSWRPTAPSARTSGASSPC